jgi:hypothetical protein
MERDECVPQGDVISVVSMETHCTKWIGYGDSHCRDCMGYANKSAHMRNNYLFSRCTKKLSKLFNNFLILSVVNSFILITSCD